MNMKNGSIVSSFRCGWQGMKHSFRGHIMQFLFLVFGCSSLLGVLRSMFFGPLHAFGWVLLIVVMCFLWAEECVNTGVEELCDLVHPEFSDRVMRIKNCFPAAGIYRGIGAVIGGLYILIYNPGP